MNNPTRPTPPASASPETEDSQVQRRSPTGERPALRPRLSSAPGELTSHERLERKLQRGRKLLDALPASDPRARLLSAAVMRRDEALLEAVLARFTSEELE